MVATKVDLDAVVRAYTTERRKMKRSELQTFRRQKSLDSVIAQAAHANMSDGRRHGHQRRITQSAMRLAAPTLLSRRERLEEATTFDELLNAVRAMIGHIDGVGPLYIYDVSLWIGAFLNHSPSRIYLQAGALDGAIALGLATRNSLHVERSEVPHPLSTLEPYEIEDALCVFKDYFAGKASLGPPSDEDLASLKMSDFES